METLRKDVTTIDKNTIALEKSFRFMEEYFAGTNKKLEEVQSCTENIDNLLRKNNLLMKGLRTHGGRRLESIFATVILGFGRP